MQAVILCGGLGTRIAKVAGGAPKSLIPVSENLTFLDVLIGFLEKANVNEIIFCVGYKQDQIVAHVTELWQGKKNTAISLKFSRELEPLGTGGAVKNALNLLQDDFVLLNGDSYTQFDLPAFVENHERKGRAVSMLVKKVHDTARYGSVTLGIDNTVTGFEEKRGVTNAFINLGIYAITKSKISWSTFGRAFSLEKDLLPTMCKHDQVGAFIADGYFIDIGIPEDLTKFRSDLKRNPDLAGDNIPSR